MPSLNDIRSTFLDFYGRNGHRVVESSPLVPRNDPTLMFANSGMVQFKNVFTGQEKRAYSRAANIFSSFTVSSANRLMPSASFSCDIGSAAWAASKWVRSM